MWLFFFNAHLHTLPTSGPDVVTQTQTQGAHIARNFTRLNNCQINLLGLCCGTTAKFNFVQVAFIFKCQAANSAHIQYRRYDPRSAARYASPLQYCKGKILLNRNETPDFKCCDKLITFQSVFLTIF